MTGVVAAGHAKTAEAGQAILAMGGNAFDAAVGALLMDCVVEPTLTSLGGGGFLLAHTAAGENTLFDFFTQTPSSRSHCARPDFYPIEANFGDTVQEFHIGKASIAVPGVLAGILHVHKKLGRLPLKEVTAPAIHCARSGFEITEFQAYCYELLDAILKATESAKQMYFPLGQRLRVGDTLRLSAFSNVLEYFSELGDEGANKAFYEGEFAQQIVKDCADSGYVTLADFQNYRVIERSPLSVNYRGVQLLTNPPPSAGGSLIAFCLELLDRFDLSKMTFGSKEHLKLLSQAMKWTNVARRSHLDKNLFDPEIANKFVDAALIEKYAKPIEELIGEGLNRWGSTTHLSVIDDEGNAASVTTSNGEGSSYVIPNTQIMMNNMLGEEDLNPHGFNQWPLNQRMSSMMAPTMILQNGKPQLVLGSGGSNRIRTAILQVISNVLDFGMTLPEAVGAARIHWENGVLHMEPGLSEALLATDSPGTQRVVQWQQPNMFFGGVHAVSRDSNGVLYGAGDPRRSGAVSAGE